MRILAFTDIHGDFNIINKLVEQSKKADILVCAGDISVWGEKLDKLISKFKNTNKRLLIIPGNHEVDEGVREVCKNYEFAICLHKASYEINNFIFFGYGEGGFSQEDKEFEEVANKFKQTIKKNSKVVLVTHAPPYGTTLDNLNGYRGCKSIRKFLEEVQPVLHICGHLHENAGNIDTIKKTVIVNPGHMKFIEI